MAFSHAIRQFSRHTCTNRAFSSYAAFTVSDLTELGYSPNGEARWVVNFRNAYQKGLDRSEFEQDQKISDDGHSGGSFQYTDMVCQSIKKSGWDTFAKSHIHLNFDEVFTHFYLHGWDGVGYIDHAFTSEREQAALQEYRDACRSDITEDERQQILKDLYFSVVKERLNP